MEIPKDSDKTTTMVVSETPRRFFKYYYVRRKSVKILNNPQNIHESVTSPPEIKDPHKEDIQDKCFSPQEDSQHVSGKGKKRNLKQRKQKQRFNRPRIMEEGKKPRNPATIRLRTISKKRKNDKDNDHDEVIAVPVTPEKQSFSKRRKNLKTKKDVARTLAFNQETSFSCLELNRNSGPTFPKGRKRMATLRRSDFHCLISEISFPMPIWKKQSKRSKRMKNMVRWAKVALSLERLEETMPLIISRNDNGPLSQVDCSLDIPVTGSTDRVALKTLSTCRKRNKKPLVQQVNPQQEHDHLSIVEVPLQVEAPKERTKRAKDHAEHLIQQMSYQKDHGLSSVADVPLHTEDTLMRSPSYVSPEQHDKKAKDISKLIKAMKRLKINNRVTTLINSSKKLVTAKVVLDQETIKEWELLMADDLPTGSCDEKEREAKWKEKREMYESRIDTFINRMHLLQGDRKFKQWKGSVVDSVVGVFLTQNVSDYLSSNAFMSVAGKFPPDVKERLEGLTYYIEEPLQVNGSMIDEQGNKDAKSSEFISISEKSIPEAEEHETTAKRKNEKTGIIEDETVDWKSLRKMYTKEGSRDMMHIDSVNWNAVRLSGQLFFEKIIRKRGQFRILSRRIMKFLNDEATQNGCVDLEWLRDAPSNLVKRYLLEIEGVGLKSAECVRLLGLKHSAFPVDTNVGRIAVRLGWVPLEPLPNGVQMHQLFQYPSMDSIQKYLWPRLCTLPQETLYELHYQMITFGKVFCTKVIPNCNACPMKSECKYFASAYVSSSVLLQGPEEKVHESDTFMHSNPQDINSDMTSSINLVEECTSPRCSEQAICCEPVIEFPSSPGLLIPELMDIEDTPCRSPYQPYDIRIPEIDIDMDALKKNVEDFLTKGGDMLENSRDEISKALVILTSENACIPINPPRKLKYYDRLRTEHVVYVLPDNHELLHDFEKREHDDPSPYLLALWHPGETSYSFTPPKKKCESDGSVLCKFKTCSYCWAKREERSNIYRGTILIPCRTATRGGFPLNGTYFQTNEVFADHKTSLKPITFPREWCDGLEKRALYCGSSVQSIFRFLDTRRIQLCFWIGFLCMRAFDRDERIPEALVRRLHTSPDERKPKNMQDDDL